MMRLPVFFLVLIAGLPLMASAQEVEFNITPTEALIDEPVVWSINGLTPYQEVTIIGQAADSSGDWRSEAVFVATADGVIDPSQQAPKSGSYHDAQPMGMVWSMMPVDHSASRFDNRQNYRLTMSVKIDANIVAYAEIIRLSPADNSRMNVMDISREGVVGRLWRPAGNGSWPGIVYIGGSGGGLNDVEAAQLAQEGFVVLDLLYFGNAIGVGLVELPQNLVHIPIEYFENAASWLARQDGVQGKHIGIYGHSRGTEAAVLTASLYDLFDAIVIRSPSAVAWMGPGRKGFRKSAWTWQGKQLPFLNTGIRDGLLWLIKLLLDEHAIITRPMFEKALLNKENMQRAILPITKMRAPILMISGEEDKQWPSDMMAELLVDKLDHVSYPYEYTHLIFRDAGHRPGIPYTPLSIEARQTFANGGTATGNAQAGIKGLAETRAFFKKHLKLDEE